VNNRRILRFSFIMMTMKENDKDHLTVLTEAEIDKDADVFFELYEQYIEEEGDPRRIRYLKSGEAYPDIMTALLRRERPCRLFWISDRNGFMIIRHEDDCIWLTDLFVIKAERGNGLGENALRELISMFPRQTVRLTPAEKAKSLYLRCGFRETEDVYEDNGHRIWQRMPERS